MIGSFGKITFEINSFYVMSIEKELTRTRKARLSEHTPVYGLGTIRHQGRELTEISFKVTLIADLGISPRKELKRFYEYLELGRYEHLVIGAQVMGEFPFLIREIQEKMSKYNSLFGDFDVVELDISLIEYVDNPRIYGKQLEFRKKGSAGLLEMDEKDVLKEQRKIGG